MSKQRVPLQHYAGPDRLERWYDSADTGSGTLASGSGFKAALVHVWGPVAVPTVIDHLAVSAAASGEENLYFVIARAADAVSLADLLVSPTASGPSAGEILGDVVGLDGYADGGDYSSAQELVYVTGLEDLTEEERTLQPGDKLAVVAVGGAGATWGATELGFVVLGRTKAPVPEATMVVG
jgi:hypothetical protein